MKKIITTLFLSVCALIPAVQAQVPTVQDCAGAIPVCQNSYTQVVSYSGIGNIDDIPDNSCPITCMSAGERNSVWYTFTVQTTGMFDFRITPFGSDDYDWALFNLGTDDCSALQNTALLQNYEVSCNWSADMGVITGANSLSPNTGSHCNDASADPNNPQIQVYAGETYYLNISNYSSTQSGYMLDMTNGSAVIFDNIPPYLLPIANPTCNATSLTFSMSENVLCSTISPLDFTITGPSAATITAVTGDVCAAGGTMENEYTLTFSPGLSPGTYTLCINGNDGHISDMCGNMTDPGNPNNCRTFTVSGFTTTATAAPTTICAGQTTTLTASGATTYQWSDGLGSSTSVSVSPSITTTYTVTGTTGACSSVDTATVTVAGGPVITINANPSTAVCPGTAVTLTASSSIGGTTYAWSTSQSGPSITPTVATTTTYTVTGTAAGCNGFQTYTVNTNPVPTVTVTPSTASVCNSQSVTLVASGANSYSWSPATGLNSTTNDTVIANPTTATTYTVTGDALGCTDDATVTVNINPLPTATISGGGNVCAGGNTVTISIALTGTGPWNLTYSDGTNATTVNNIATSPYTFSTNAPGVYTVTSVSDANCPGTSSGAAILNNYPLPNVNLPVLPAVCVNAPAYPLSGGTPAGGTYSGPGVSLNNFNPTTAGAGTHNIIYTYTDGNGCTNRDTNTLTVNALPTVTLPAFATTCVTTAPFALSGGTPAGGTYSGPGVSGGTFDPATAGVGTHNIVYTYTDANSCTNSATNTLQVINGPTVTLNTLPPVCADAAAFALSGGSPAGGTFSGTGVAAGSFDPAVSGPGTFTITYSYTDPTAGCVATATQPQVVNPLPALTHSTLNDVCVTSPSFVLTGGSPAGGTYSGPGVAPNIFDPSAAGVGTHTLTYTYTDTSTQCTNTMTTDIVVAPGIPVTIDPAVTYICEGASTTLTAGGASNYTWTPSTGLTSTTGPVVIATPPSTLTYTVTGTNPDGCAGMAMATVNLFPPVNITFLPVPANGCKPLNVDFIFVPDAQIEDSSWSWNFGDILSEENTSTELNPSHLYIEEGNYTVTLNATTINGCAVTATMPVNVYNKPIADFYWLPEVGNMSNPLITFVDASVGANYWYWNFGDPGSFNNNESNLQGPTHVYSDSGVYEVQLIVEANHGCSDTIVKYVTIYPETLIYVPNAFTPDHNGLNDTWAPSVIGVLDQGYSLEIWDRWGKRIWWSGDILGRWDGRVSGSDKVVPSGTYAWVLRYEDPTGKEYKMMGIVNVIR